MLGTGNLPKLGEQTGSQKPRHEPGDRIVLDSEIDVRLEEQLQVLCSARNTRKREHALMTGCMVS